MSEQPPSTSATPRGFTEKREAEEFDRVESSARQSIAAAAMMGLGRMQATCAARATMPDLIVEAAKRRKQKRAAATAALPSVRNPTGSAQQQRAFELRDAIAVRSRANEMSTSAERLRALMWDNDEPSLLPCAVDAEGDSSVAAHSADYAFSASRSAASSASFVSRILALRSDAARQRKTVLSTFRVTAPHDDARVERGLHRRSDRHDRLALWYHARDGALVTLLDEFKNSLDNHRPAFQSSLDNAASVTIQKYFRRFSVRKAYRRCTAALQVLQRSGRGWIERLRGIGLSYRRREATATLQRVGRAALDKRAFNRDVLRRVREFHKLQAATNIQKNYRMHTSRSNFVQHKRRVRGATVLQRVMQRFVARERERQRVEVAAVSRSYLSCTTFEAACCSDANTSVGATLLAFERWEYARRTWLADSFLEWCVTARQAAAVQARALRRHQLAHILSTGEMITRTIDKYLSAFDLTQRADSIMSVRTAGSSMTSFSRSGAFRGLRSDAPSEADAVSNLGGSTRGPLMASQLLELSQPGAGDSSPLSASTARPFRGGGTAGLAKAIAAVKAAKSMLRLCVTGQSTRRSTLIGGGSDMAEVTSLFEVDELVAFANTRRDAPPGSLYLITGRHRRMLHAIQAAAQEITMRYNTVILAEAEARLELFAEHIAGSDRFVHRTAGDGPSNAGLVDTTDTSPELPVSLTASPELRNPLQFFYSIVESTRRVERAAALAAAQDADAAAIRATTELRRQQEEAAAAEQARRWACDAAVAAATEDARRAADAQRHQTEVRAATVIQAAARAFACRRRYRMGRSYRRGQISLTRGFAEIMQDAGRGFMTRRQLGHQRAQVSVGDQH
jgi:hypothetical protein